MVKDELDEETRRVGADAALLKGDFDGPVLRAVLERVVAARVPPSRDGDDDLPDDLRTLAGDVLDAFARERALHAVQAYRLALLAKAAFAHKSLKGSPIEACARLATLPRATRDAWTERVFAEGLTVRQLREILKGAARD